MSDRRHRQRQGRDRRPQRRRGLRPGVLRPERGLASASWRCRTRARRNPARSTRTRTTPPRSRPNQCEVADRRILERLSDGSNGTINPGSTLVQRIQCLRARRPTTSCPTPGPANGSGQPHEPRRPDAAAQAAARPGRPEAADVIIFFADGQSNQPTSTRQPCQYANDAATSAKLAGTAIFALGYGVDTTRCAAGHEREQPLPQPRTGPTSSPRRRGIAPDQGALGQHAPAGARPTRTRTSDYYFCESRGEDLDAVFHQIAVPVDPAQSAAELLSHSDQALQVDRPPVPP